MPKYKLTDGDLAIIKKALATRNPNWFLNYYMRSPNSGTWWLPVLDEQLKRLQFPEFTEQAEKKRGGYEKLADIWHKLGEPEYFGFSESAWLALNDVQYEERIQQMEMHNYRAVYQHGKPGPMFHNNHGMMLIPWSLTMYHQNAFRFLVIGGLGSGKTLNVTLQMLYHAATLRGYRGFALAPNSFQSEEFHTLATDAIAGTLYEERFLVKAPLRPRPTLIISHDHIGTSRIECIPVAKEPQKARTVTGDECVIDQSEKFDGEMLAELRRSMGTRFRGMLHGRQKVGRSIYLANSGDNPELWGMFDEAKINPQDVWAYSPPTVENPHLTVDDFIRFQSDVGETEEERRMFLRGERPMGSGEHFTATMLKQMKDDDYTLFIQRRSEEPVQEIPESDRIPMADFMWREDIRLGCYYFRTPARSDRRYAIAADPGTKNPPNRDTAVIGVWDVTDFPDNPAVLVAFSWVFGRNDITNWMQQYFEWAVEYRCAGNAGYDGTAQQSGYQKFPFGFQDIEAVPYNFGGNAKWGWLKLVKLFMRRGLLRAPHIAALFNQCVNYKLPDDKIAQDIVMMLVVLAAMLEHLWYAVFGADGEEIEEDSEDMRPDIDDRYARPAESRYPGHKR